MVYESSWVYTNGNLTAASNNGRYNIWVAARDKAGNVQSSFAVAASSRPYFRDKDVPLVGLVSPASVWGV